MKVKTLDSLDAAKFVMSVAVVVMHSSFLAGSKLGILFWPWVRVAVPLFFMISSYLFFSKDGRGWNGYIKFLKRIGLLCGMWTLFAYPWIPLKHGCIAWLKAILFEGLWGPLWFMSALCVSILLIKLCSDLVPHICFAGLFVFMFILSCFASSYGHIWYSDYKCMPFVGAWSIFFGRPHLGFPIGLVWCCCGWLFAKKRVLLELLEGQRCLWFAGIGGVCLLAEWIVLYELTRGRIYDVYFSLIILCPVLFALLLRMKFTIYFARFLRNTSTVIYMSHVPLLTILRQHGISSGSNHVGEFLILIGFGVIFTAVLRTVSRIKFFVFFKYAY